MGAIRSEALQLPTHLYQVLAWTSPNLPTSPVFMSVEHPQEPGLNTSHRILTPPCKPRITYSHSINKENMARRERFCNLPQVT